MTPAAVESSLVAALADVPPPDDAGPTLEGVRSVDLQPQLALLPAREAGYARAARAANTLRGYRFDWADFTTWCAAAGYAAMPAAPAALAGYLVGLAGAGAKVGTLSRRLSSIRFAHASAGHPDPATHPRVATVWEGIRRTRAAPPTQALPLMPPLLFDVLAACPTTRAAPATPPRQRRPAARQPVDAYHPTTTSIPPAGHAPTPVPGTGAPTHNADHAPGAGTAEQYDLVPTVPATTDGMADHHDIAEWSDLTDLGGVRDRALLLVGFVAALRRSELTALDVADVAKHPNGLVLTLPRSKTNQSGEHTELVMLPRAGSPDRCPVLALQRWTQLAAITEGPLFRAVTKAGRPSARRLHPESVNVLVQRAVARAGTDATGYSAHSLRAGFVTYAHLRGASEAAYVSWTEPGRS